METKYSFAKADLDSSRIEVAALWAQGLGGLVDRTAELKYRQYYLENPAGRADCVVLVHNAEGKAVGVQGFVPRRFWRGDKPVTAAVMADFVVVPEHRSLGPALQLMRSGIEMSKARFAFLYGTPNQKSLAIVRRAGLTTIGQFTRYTKVVRSASYWQRRVPGWLVPILAFLTDGAIVVVDLPGLRLGGDSLTWDEQSEFGEEFDVIWQRRFGDRVYGDRSRDVLTWRYREANGKEPWRRSLARDHAGAPAGYVVWRLREGVALISDFLIAKADVNLQTAMRSFAWHARKLGVERISLEFFGIGEVSRALLAAGFAPREQSLVVHVEHDGSVASLSAATAYMTSFDRDHEE